MTRAHTRAPVLPWRVTAAAVLCLFCTLLACAKGEQPPSLETIELVPSGPSLTLAIGESTRLNATAIYSDASRQAFAESLSWASSDAAIVSVEDAPSSKGVITGRAPGTATITALHAATGKSAQVQVTVPFPPPVLRAVSPNTGPAAGGTEITLEGQWFMPGVIVSIGGNPVRNLSRVSDTSLTAVTPAGAEGPQDVVVITARGTATLPRGFTYFGEPTITQMVPSSGPMHGGTEITLRGSNFIPGTVVTLDGAELLNVTVIDENTLTGVTPPSTQEYTSVRVTNARGSALFLGQFFRYYDPWSASSSGMYGGFVSVLAGQPSSEPYFLYAGTIEGGVFMSVDSGEHWLPISGKGLTDLDIRALAIHPTSSTTLYAGTNNGLFKTTDQGHSWSKLSHTLESLPIYALALDPATPTTLYAGVPTRGVFKTTDGGATWTAVNNGLSSLYVKTLAMDPSNSQILYAGTMEGAIFKTSNGGASWFPARTGIPSTVSFINTLVIDPRTPETVYAGTTRGVYKTTTGGGSWTTVNTGLGERVVDSLSIVPDMPNTLYAGTWQGLFRTTTGGTSWSNISAGLASTEINAVLAGPNSTGIVHVGTISAGVFKTANAAGSWALTHSGMTNLHVRALAFSPVLRGVAYAGTSNGVFRSTSSGDGWTELSQGLGNRQVHSLALHPTDRQILYAGTYRGLYKTADGGASWAPVFSTDAIIDAVAIHPTSPTTVYTGTTQGLFKSTDSGGSWSTPGQGLPPNTWVRGIAFSRQTPSTVYVAAQSKVYRSVDDGAQWQEVSTGLPSSPEFNEIHVAPAPANTVYVVSNNEGVYKLAEGGTTWEQVYEGNVAALAIDPVDPQTLYVGTNRDIRKSRDGGRTWRLASSPFFVRVDALAVEPQASGTVLAGTERRGVYRTITGGQ
jgi:photosystem II stability/assembly factor-like uncharacterized protein